MHPTYVVLQLGSSWGVPIALKTGKKRRKLSGTASAQGDITVLQRTRITYVTR